MAALLSSLLQSATGPRASSKPKRRLEGVESVECYLRRDGHGGFGIFFEDDDAAAAAAAEEGRIRWIEPLAAGADGRQSLAIGDTITRVGGLPTPTTASVVEALMAGDSVLSVTAAKTSLARTAPAVTTTKKEDDGPLSRHHHKEEDPLPATRVPSARLDFCAVDALFLRRGERAAGGSGGGGESHHKRKLSLASLGGSVVAHRSEDVETIGKAAIIAMGDPRSEPSWPCGHSSVAAAVGRELSRCDELAKGVVERCDHKEDPTAKAATRLAGAVSTFSAAVKVAGRPEFARSQNTGFSLNVAGLAAPDVALASRGVLPLTLTLAKSLAPNKMAATLRGLKECERREAHARRLADLTRSLKDDAVRSLSETDLDLAVRAAFADLADAVKSRDAAQLELDAICRKARAVGGDDGGGLPAAATQQASNSSSSSSSGRGATGATGTTERKHDDDEGGEDESLSDDGSRSSSLSRSPPTTVSLRRGAQRKWVAPFGDEPPPRRVVFLDDDVASQKDPFSLKDDDDALLAAIFGRAACSSSEGSSEASSSEASSAEGSSSSPTRTPTSRPGKFLWYVRRAKEVLVEGASRRTAASALALEQLDSTAKLDAAEAEACYAVARCEWARRDAERHEELATELADRERDLAEKARTMASRIKTHADALAVLSDSARDRLVAALEPVPPPPLSARAKGSGSSSSSEEAPPPPPPLLAAPRESPSVFGRYFDLAQESIDARSNLVRRQILRDREQVIASLDAASKELQVTRRDFDRVAATEKAFRGEVEGRLGARARLVEDVGLACARAKMLSSAAFASLAQDLRTAADHILEVAAQVAKLDVDLRLAHVRLVALALRVEIDRAQRAAFFDAPPGSAAKRVATLFDAVNGTKRELHRVRDDACFGDEARVVEAALADLAEVEVLGSSVAAAADAESADARADKRRRLRQKSQKMREINNNQKNTDDDHSNELGQGRHNKDQNNPRGTKDDDDDSEEAHADLRGDDDKKHRDATEPSPADDDARLQLEAFASPYDDRPDDDDDDAPYPAS